MAYAVQPYPGRRAPCVSPTTGFLHCVAWLRAWSVRCGTATGGYRLQRNNLGLRGDRSDRLGINGTDSGIVSRVAWGAAIIGGKRRAAVAITGAVADGGNWVSNGQYVKDKGDNHKHIDIEEVIHSNNDHREYPVITGRLEQAVNRR